MDPELACIWLVIGKGKSKWLIGQVYREHMTLGNRESASVENQKYRWRMILKNVSKTDNYENVTIMDDRNIKELTRLIQFFMDNKNI